MEFFIGYFRSSCNLHESLQRQSLEDSPAHGCQFNKYANSDDIRLVYCDTIGGNNLINPFLIDYALGKQQGLYDYGKEETESCGIAQKPEIADF